MTVIFLILFTLGIVTSSEEVTDQVVEENKELINDFIVTGDIDTL